MAMRAARPPTAAPRWTLALCVSLPAVALAAGLGPGCAAGNDGGGGASTDEGSSSSTVAASSTESSAQSSSTGFDSSTGSISSGSLSSGSSGSASGGTGGGGSGSGSGGGSSTSGSGASASSASSSGSANSSSSSASASSSSGGTGGASAGTLILLGVGATSGIGAQFHPGTGWTTTSLTLTDSASPSLVMTGDTSALGVFEATDMSVNFISWSAGMWGTASQIAAGVTTRDTPSLAGSSIGEAGLVFQGTDFKHYYAAHSATWGPTAEAVSFNGTQSFGPSPAAIARLGTDTIIAYQGNDLDLYDQTRSGGTWQAAQPHNLGAVLSLPPRMVALSAGPELMVVFVRKTDANLLYTTRKAGIWSTPALLTNGALSNDPVSLVALEGGGALVGFRGQDGKLYTLRYTGGASPSWGVAIPLASNNFMSMVAPALAAGAFGDDAELAFIDQADNLLKHSRLNGVVWSAPAAVSNVASLTRVALASSP